MPTFKIKVGSFIFERDLTWDDIAVAKELVKQLGFRWDPEARMWVREEPPLLSDTVNTLRFKFGIDLPYTYMKYYRSFAYVVPHVILDYSKFEYEVTRYKKVSCEEYCEAKGFENIDACIRKCETEGWNTMLKVEEKVQLWKREDDGMVRIPRGLASRLEYVSRKFGLPPVKFTDGLSTDGFEGLRNYQAEVGKSLLRAAESYGGGIAVMATGGGKSYMAGWLAKQLVRNDYNVIVTSLSLDLTTQLRDFAKRWGVDVTAVTIQTLYRRLLNEKDGNGGNGDDKELDEEDKEVLQYMDEEDLSKQEVDRLHKIFFSKRAAVIIDEAHHVPARTVKAVAMSVGDGWGLRFGLTATPFRNDGRELEIEAFVGPIVEPRISSSFLIEHGYAVPVTIRMLRTGDWGCESRLDVDNPARVYAHVRKCLAENKERNEFIMGIIEEAPKPVLVITPLVKHAELLHKMAKERFDKVALATGVVKGAERERIFNAVREGGVDVLVATTLADEGLDLPPLRSLIVALGGKSKTRTLQRVGRLVRPFEGKEEAVAYDIWDKAEYFVKQGEVRKQLYETEPYWKIKVEWTGLG